MPPLILHNVPDEELYVGEDGIQRPYAMLFPGNEGNPAVSRARRAVPETGSFGKSTRRSRSRTGTPAVRREDPTLAAADAIFSSFLSNRAAASSESPQRKGAVPSSVSVPNLSGSNPLGQIDGNAGGPSSRYIHKEPTEVILRGFKPTNQYAAIREYERIGGRICEDYPRDPPPEQRRYKSDLRDPASLRTQPMTVEEKAKAMRYAGGEHWIKVTFESAEAAEAAVDSSPQTILGHSVFAELYRGVPPTVDEAIPANGARREVRSMGISSGKDIFGSAQRAATSSTLPRSFTTPSMSEVGRGSSSLSPPGSNSSSRTLDTATLSTTSASTGTLIGQPLTQMTVEDDASDIFCRRIPTAKKAKILPAELALLPQKSYWQRILAQVPFLSWFSNDIIGNQVPKTEDGQFDWKNASVYWKLMWYLDRVFGGFDVCNGDKED